MFLRSTVVLPFLLLTCGICQAQVKIKVLQASLDYSFGYATDLTSCFILPPVHTPTEVVALGAGPGNEIRDGRTGSKWLVIFQAHTQQDLNVTNTFNPSMRTLKWGTPYDNAVIAITKGSLAHDNSALLRAWYLGKVRKFATFICIPPRSEVRFWSGYAAPMSVKVKEAEDSPEILRESRPGGGMQWRFHSLPKGTICLTIGLFTEESGKMLDKEDKKMDLQARFAECVKAYNEHPVGGVRLPVDLAQPQTFKNAWDDVEILNHYLDLSTTRLKPYVASHH